MSNGNVSPLESLSIERFKGHTFGQETVVQVASIRTTVLRNNPNRVFVALINEGANDVRISYDTSLSAVSGWLIPAAGGVITLNWEDDGETVGYELFAITAGADVQMRIREVIRT